MTHEEVAEKVRAGDVLLIEAEVLRLSGGSDPGAVVLMDAPQNGFFASKGVAVDARAIHSVLRKRAIKEGDKVEGVDGGKRITGWVVAIDGDNGVAWVRSNIDGARHETWLLERLERIG